MDFRKRARRIAASSLAHFVIGCGLIAGIAAFTEQQQLPRDDEIKLSSGRERVLVDQYKRMFGRPPSSAERLALIDNYLEQEILVREALRLELHRDDLIVRRRLEQKMRTLLGSQWDGDISRSDLAGFYRQHLDDFMRPAEVGLEQLFYSSDIRGSDARADAADAIAALRRGEPPSDPGDPWFFDASPRPRPLPAIAGEFGSAFAEILSSQERGSWVGPIASGYGHHAVRILTYSPPVPRDFEEVKLQVWSRYLDRLQQATLKAKLIELKQRYRVAAVTADD